MLVVIGLGNWRVSKLSRCWWWVSLSKDRRLPQCQWPLNFVGEEKHDLSHPYVLISNRSKNHNINVPVSTLTASRSSSASYVMLLSVLRHQKLQTISDTCISRSFLTSKVHLLPPLLLSSANESMIFDF